MGRAGRVMRIGAAGALLVAARGCGGGGAPPVSTSREEATVKGTVTVLGKTAVGGEVVFDPSNKARPDASPRSAPIGPDGAYTIRTMVGGNSVAVHTPEIDNDPVLSVNIRRVEVKSGENTVPLDVP